MVSHFLWAFSQHHADLHVIVQLRRDFRRCPSDVPTTSTFPQTLKDYHSFVAVAQLAASRISDPRFSARCRPPCVSPHFEPISVRHSLHQCQASSRGQCRHQGVQCVTQRSDVRSRRKVHHRLGLCVQKECHVSLIHQGGVVLELGTELEPRLLFVVVLDRFRSKFQNFCDDCRRCITAPLPCANFGCVVTRSTTAEFQHNDMMMRTTVLNDLRLEMAHEMRIVSVHEKSEQL